MWDRDSSPTRISETVHRQNWRQFTDRFEDNSSTKNVYMYVYMVLKGRNWLKL